ncbi:ABC transporter ATP-binding protein [Actinomyces sp. zg296]|uniref:ABC transporter ATP-binding protein n=1 Tax=Actinomyces sp. zg296 TaxID=2609289 RepID=UPI001357F459|nr:ATP-binding cassette domain-containing protein [Actinomyces sp. zg296]
MGVLGHRLLSNRLDGRHGATIPSPRRPAIRWRRATLPSPRRSGGAGKSTTMRITMGVLEADSGTTTWDGVELDASFRRSIGYMPEERGLYPKMRVGEQLTYLGRLHGLSKSAAQASSDAWTERLGVAERRDDDVQKLSLGNQQRVQLAAALVGDPALLILDEPFSGLDPVAVEVMSDVIRERAAAGVPTLFSSHQLDVVERLVDRVIIIRSGGLVADGTVEELRATGGHRWRAVVEAARLDEATALAAMAALPEPAAAPGRLPGTLELTCGGPDEQALLAVATRLGALRELGQARRSLTEVFREVLAAPSPAAQSSEKKEARA